MEAPFQDQPKTQAKVVLKDGWSLMGVQFHVNLKARFLKRGVVSSDLFCYKHIPKPRTPAQTQESLATFEQHGNKSHHGKQT